MDNSPSVSVVIPNYNGGLFVERAIRSALDQNYPSLDIIVADDGSTDDSLDTLRRWVPTITLSAGRNSGACVARNRGLALSRAEFVLFLDADDTLDPGYVQLLASAATEHVDLVVGGHRHLGSNGEVLRTVSYRPGESCVALLSDFLHENVQTGAVLWRRSWLLERGGWNETLPMFQDVEVMIRALLARPRVRVIDPGPLRAIWHEHDAPDRITNSFRRDKAEAVLGVLDENATAIITMGGARAKQGLTHHYYMLARRAFGARHDDVGRRALRSARALGLRGHQGSLAHCVLSTLVGLRLKTQIGRLAGRVRYT
jgi:glycosyltransferase involved in cell wall biosynthesis